MKENVRVFCFFYFYSYVFYDLYSGSRGKIVFFSSRMINILRHLLHQHRAAISCTEMASQQESLYTQISCELGKTQGFINTLYLGDKKLGFEYFLGYLNLKQPKQKKIVCILLHIPYQLMLIKKKPKLWLYRKINLDRNIPFH